MAENAWIWDDNPSVTTYTEGTPGVLLDPFMYFTANIVGQLATFAPTGINGAVFTITTNYHPGQDYLNLISLPGLMGDITSTFNVATGQLTLTGSGISTTAAQWNAAVQAITYINTSQNPDTSQRAVTITPNVSGANNGTMTHYIDVTAVNNAPVNTVPFALEQILNNGSVIYSHANGNQIFVSDVDAGTNSIQVSLKATGGTFALASISGLTVSGDGTANVTMTGTVSDINKALNGLAFNALGSFSGTGSIQITTNDLGHTGTGGALTDTDTTYVTVIAATPTVQSVTAFNGNGTYKPGDTLTITVQFDQQVIVDTTSGTPTLLLETGTTDHAATYLFGTGTSKLTFSYQVQAGDLSNDLDYQSISALALNGAKIYSPYGYSATLTLPTPGSANSIAGQKNIVIDGVGGAVTGVSSSTADGTYKVGDTILIDVTFSENVAVGGSPQLLLNTGAHNEAATYQSGNGTNKLTFAYTVQAGDTSADLDYASSAALSGTMTDLAGNAITLTLPGVGAAGSLSANKNIVINTTTASPSGAGASVVDVTSTSPDGTYKIGDTVNLTVTFNHAVTVDTTKGVPTLMLNAGVLNEFAPYVSGSGTTTLTFAYVVRAGDQSSDLNYASAFSLLANGGTIKDASSVDAVLTLPATNDSHALASHSNIVIDGSTASTTPTTSGSTAPAVTDVTSSLANGNYKTGDTVSLTVHFDKAVTVDTAGGLPSLTLDAGPTNEFATYVSGTGTQDLVFSFTVHAADISSDLNYLNSFSLLSNGSVIHDATGTAAVLTLPATSSIHSLAGNKDIVLNGATTPTTPTTPTVPAPSTTATTTVLSGPGGNTIIVQSGGAIPSSAGSSGIDTVFFSGGGTISLPDNIENVVLNGTAGGTIIGNGLGNNFDLHATGTTIVDGGAGFDTASFSGARQQYSIKISQGTTVVTDTVHGSVAGLLNVEKLQFSNASVNLTMSALASSIAPKDLQSLEELYVGFYNRLPDADGLAFWINQLKSGQSLTQIANQFYDAGVQFSAMTGYTATMSNADFITKIYANVLGRSGASAPNASEISYWSNRLVSGADTKGSLLLTMINNVHDNFKGDPTYGYVDQLLLNKAAAATYLAISQGLTYNAPADSYALGQQMAALVTPTDITKAIALVGITDGPLV